MAFWSLTSSLSVERGFSNLIHRAVVITYIIIVIVVVVIVIIIVVAIVYICYVNHNLEKKFEKCLLSTDLKTIQKIL